MSERIAVIGLGYAGLPLAVAFARRFTGTIGFDIRPERVGALRQGVDRTGEVSPEDLRASGLKVTSDPADLTGATFFVVTVPTPVDRHSRPDLNSLLKATKIVGLALRPGSVVVYESTVYPGVTEEICCPVLAEMSKLRPGTDFKLGYSPERINPGDEEHTLERVVKVVAGEDAPTLKRIAEAYASIVEAGVHQAPSIKVAEAAKVIENVQRDLNIALMNELALIFDRMDIQTRDVLEAANTKWNFLPFIPGLVGGHCIGVDPYYLTTKAEELGYHPQVILAGRRINDGMGTYVAQRTVKLLMNAGLPVKGCRVGILGITFKENVSDLRNSRVPDIVAELKQFGIDPLVHDPLADAREARDEYGICLRDWRELHELDAIVYAVDHKFYRRRLSEDLMSRLRSDGVLVDVKSAFSRESIPSSLYYWSL
jgi:UDP-N-acetyl-D-galactosamine dehydrogenase